MEGEGNLLETDMVRRESLKGEVAKKIVYGGNFVKIKSKRYG